jgi:hypothetical protein
MIYRFKNDLRRFIGQYSSLYLSIKKIQGKYGILNSQTEIVIEGYPRCANSFAEAAFRVAQDKEVSIAHHTHAPAQVLDAVKKNIPTIVVFRDPDDAVISRMMRDKKLKPAEAYNEYIWFYNSIWGVLDSCVLSNFEQTINCFGETIRAVNKYYNTRFNEFEHSNAEAVKRAKELIDELSLQRIGRATQYSKLNQDSKKSRNMQKESLKSSIKQESIKSVRNKANMIYEQLERKCFTSNL